MKEVMVLWDTSEWMFPSLDLWIAQIVVVFGQVKWVFMHWPFVLSKEKAYPATTPHFKFLQTVVHNRFIGESLL